MPASATQAPLHVLSCPYCSGQHGCDSLRSDYWNPPTNESQHARQRILTAMVASILAAILAQAGW